VLNDGCSGVWASPTLDRADGLLFFGVADCNGSNPLPYSGRLVALHVSDGRLAWVFTPARLDNADPSCDFDIGASANYGKLPNGTAFLGVGSKDGTYYSIDPRTGQRRWATNVVFGGVAGGFIGTAAFDGRHIYAATAIGDLPQPCENSLRDLQVEEPSIHALSATGGAVLWEGALAASFSPTTLAGGMVFSGTVLYHLLEIHDASTGQLLRAIPLLADTVSGVVVSGHTVFIGTGDNFQGSPGGVQALTPAAHLLDG
jgi:outer membrane protein assembly factor BamB